MVDAFLIAGQLGLNPEQMLMKNIDVIIAITNIFFSFQQDLAWALIQMYIMHYILFFYIHYVFITCNI